MISLKSLFLQYKKEIIIINLIGFCTTIIGLTIPSLVGQLINIVGNGNNTLSYQLLTGFGIVVTLVLGFGIMENIFVSRFGEKVAFNLREKIMDKLTSLNYAQVNKQGVGNILTVTGSDIDGIKQVISTEFLFTFQAILLFIFSLFAIFIGNWKLGLVSLVSLPLIILVFMFVFRNVMKYFKQAAQNSSQSNTVISQNIYAFNLIRVQNSGDFESLKFSFWAENAKIISDKIVTSFASLIPSIGLITNWTLMGILYLGGVLYLQKDINLGNVSSFLTYYSLLITPIFIIGFNSQAISRASISVGRLNEIFKLESVKESGEKKGGRIKEIEFDNVNLSKDGKNLLKDISFKIKTNGRSAIIGPTGAGKSLIINMINGLIHPDSGEIRINGVNINLWDREFLRGKISTVFQESLIFNSTICENIILNHKYDNKHFDTVIEAANLVEFNDKELKLAQVSELGSNLSGGQKQRITLARALYGKPQILLLDDFTARVDKKTENNIWNKLNENFPSTAIINISQNIDSIKDFDQIIVLMEGELIGSGTHQNLITSNKEYQQIYASQQLI